MKKIFVCLVLILSILLAVCGCSNVMTENEPFTDSTDVEGDNSSQPTINPTETETEGSEPTDTDTEITVTDEDDATIIEPTETEPEENEPEEPETEFITPVVNVPVILINELRTEYDSSPKRAEYIELKVKKSGNLQGIKLYIMWNSIMPYIFSLPAIDVKEGEYITYHLRTLGNNCIDELGDNLALSGGNDACPTARDLWVSGSEKWLHKTDIVYLQDADGNILDAVVLNEKPNTAWVNERKHFTGILEFLFNKDAWKTVNGTLADYLDAVDTSGVGTSSIISICRYENDTDTNTKNDWYVTASNGNSPGLPNN